MSVEKKIVKILTEHNITCMKIVNDSEQHKDHGSYRDGQTHFSLVLVSSEFKELSKIKRHQIVYGFLEELLKSRIHALSIRTYTPEEINSINFNLEK